MPEAGAILMQMRLITKLWNWITQHCVILVNYFRVEFVSLIAQLNAFLIANPSWGQGANKPTNFKLPTDASQPVSQPARHSALSLSQADKFPFEFLFLCCSKLNFKSTL